MVTSQPNGLWLVKTNIYDKLGWLPADVVADRESAAYGGCSFILNGHVIIYREAKITPTKPGLFVTIWKRNVQGITAPYDIVDCIDLFIISVTKGERTGQFVFPAGVLLAQGVLSGNGKDGKRGIRVYPPWDTNLNKQATKTQQWQAGYFLELLENSDVERAKMLYCIT